MIQNRNCCFTKNIWRDTYGMKRGRTSTVMLTCCFNLLALFSRNCTSVSRFSFFGCQAAVLWFPVWTRLAKKRKTKPSLNLKSKKKCIYAQRLSCYYLCTCWAALGAKVSWSPASRAAAEECTSTSRSSMCSQNRERCSVSKCWDVARDSAPAAAWTSSVRSTRDLSTLVSQQMGRNMICVES